MSIIDTTESQVRSYSRAFPATFEKALGSHLFDTSGNDYLDFFSGAGAVNYGHNDPQIKQALLDYLQADGLVHGMDLDSTVRREFLARFRRKILEPRGLDYKVQFPGPTGTNAVEAAIKLARKLTRRRSVAYFANAFHGMTLGALSVTDSAGHRAHLEDSLGPTVRLPYDGSPEDRDGKAIEEFFHGDSAPPAAVIVETIQGEGGIRIAGRDWLRNLLTLAQAYGTLLIVDEVQTGCGRSGPFFGFEAAGIEPDLVCLSKSLSGSGLPLAAVLIKPELDGWRPGEHSGTFRSNNLALVGATAALDYWDGDDLAREIEAKAETVHERLKAIVTGHPRAKARVRGRGMMWGLAFEPRGLARAVSREAFRGRVLAETADLSPHVLKIMPPLTISEIDLGRGLDVLERSLATALQG